jgi:AcrR family transcriptional regulator
VPTRTPQQERSRVTQQRLLTATLDCLVERGWSGTTTTLVAAKAEHRVDQVIDLLAAAFTGPLFVAALEVWVAARTDPELRTALVPLEAKVGREMHRLAVELLDADELRPPVRETVQATLDLLRGLGVANLLSDDSPRRRAILHAWKQQLADILRSPRG